MRLWIHGAQGCNLIIFSDRKKFFDAFAISHITLCFRGSISVVILKPFAHEKYHNKISGAKCRPEAQTRRNYLSTCFHLNPELPTILQTVGTFCLSVLSMRPTGIAEVSMVQSRLDALWSSELPSSMVNC